LGSCITTEQMSTLKELSTVKTFGGWVKRYSHLSTTVQTEMKFYVFLPPQVNNAPAPVLYYLSGLECSDENFIVKGGAFEWAAKYGIILVSADTSPRGAGVEGETDSWDFGVGAGFYVDATEPKWAKNYRMYSYITNELPNLINSNFPTIPEKKSIFGHSMGGHGALICALKNPGTFKSVSAFAPISHPSVVPWGRKAFSGYLGSDESKWKEYDATELVGKYHGEKLDILIDQGTGDRFHNEQLKPEDFEVAAKSNSHVSVTLRLQQDYNHSYFFVSTFMQDHIAHHAKYLF